MNLELTPDQESLRDAVVRMVEPFKEAPAGCSADWLDGSELYRTLEEGGFLEVANVPEFGALGAAVALETVSTSPYSVPLAGSLLVAPLAFEEPLEGPVAFMRPGDRLVRHLPLAKTLVVAGLDGSTAYEVAHAPKALETPFGDPYAPASSLKDGRPLTRKGDVDVLDWLRLAAAIEIAGAARSAVDLTVEHVKLRRQFDRPIGSFQAIQHRLSECEVLVHAIQALSRWAAGTSDPQAIGMAASFAQSAVERIAYDTQQFHGASGVTKQGSLHFYVYRLRALQGALGGTAKQCMAAADALWPVGAGA